MKIKRNDLDARKKINWQSMTIYFGTVMIFIIFTLLTAMEGRNFLTWSNISNIIVQTSVIAVISIGTSFVIITGGIDLSVGSIVGFSTMATAILLKADVPMPVCILVGILIGAIVGTINGILISRYKIPAFIATLGTMGIARGGALALTQGKALSGFPPGLGKMATADLFGIPVFIVYVVVLYAIAVFITNKTKLGRYIYAIGGNRNAAKYSGVKVTKYEIITYAIAGLMGGIGSVMLLSRLIYASPTAGTGYEMSAIAACVIGGISLSGGQGKVINTLVGALIMGILTCGLQMLNISTYFQEIATGLIIILAVYFDKAKDRKAE